MMLFWAVLMIVIVWGIIAFTRSANQPGQAVPRGETPLDVLKRRYATGEINKDQFEEMKRTLGV